MNYLIFRTDRIGDFLITLPVIKAIKRNNTNAKIFVVTSTKNNDFVKSNYLISDVYLLKENNLFNKLLLFFKLRKKKFTSILVSDKKNRSILLSLFLKSKKKIFNVSKTSKKKILSFFFKDVYIDNDSFINTSVKDLNKMNCQSLEIDLIDNDYQFFLKDQFKDKYNYDDIFKLDENDFIIFHCDEKWELDSYSKLFSKAKSFTDINININNLQNFISKITKKKKMKIVITTGYFEINIINRLKKISKNLASTFYEIDKNSFLITNQNFESISHLISKSKLFISCHGAFTHIASNYNIKILDIIEKNKERHYFKITKHMRNYVCLSRTDFNELNEEIIKYS